MDYPSSRELLRKAGGKTQRADRWAMLQSESKEKVWVGEKREKTEDNERKAMENIRKTAPKQEEQAVEMPEETPTPYVLGHPNLREPPFPPPQNRHTALDDIWQKHLQALQSAMPAQEWKKGEKNEEAGTKGGE